MILLKSVALYAVRSPTQTHPPQYMILATPDLVLIPECDPNEVRMIIQ